MSSSFLGPAFPSPPPNKEEMDLQVAGPLGGLSPLCTSSPWVVCLAVATLTQTIS